VNPIRAGKGTTVAEQEFIAGLMSVKDRDCWPGYVYRPIIPNRGTHMTESQSRPAELVGRMVAEADASGDLVFDAAAVAPLLGLAPGSFMEELRRGVVYHVHERGTKEDIGKSRVTFRYRALQSVLTVDVAGRALDVA
jgi:hypothetical protein